MTAWIAFIITRTDSEDAYYGSLKVTAKTDTDLAAREVLMHDFQILELSIEGLDDDADEVELIRNGFMALSRKVPLDLVPEYLPHSIPLDNVEGLNTEPPTIFVSKEPAILLSVDTQAMFLQVGETRKKAIADTVGE